MFLEVDISVWIALIFQELFDVLFACFGHLDSIIIFNGALFGLDFNASLLDFLIGITVVGIVLGAFVRLSKADKFYGER